MLVVTGRPCRSAATASWRPVRRHSKFIPYEAARALVHNQNLKSFTEWLEWSKTSRPTVIPRNPQQAYAKQGWISYPDFVGYERRIPKVWAPEDFTSDVMETAASDPFTAVGVVRVQEWISRADPNFECRFLPRKMSANLLVRHKKVSATVDGPEGKDDGWIALRVFGSQQRVRKSSLRFSIVRAEQPNVHLSFVSEPLGKFTVSTDKDCQLLKNITFPADVFLRETELAVEKLRNLCHDESQNKTFWGWMLGLEVSKDMNAYCQHLFGVHTRLLHPAGVSVSFPEPRNARQWLINCYIGGYRCCFRKARQRSQGSHYSIDLIRRHVSGKRSFYSVNERFGLFMVSIYNDKKLAGVFVLPKAVIDPYLASPKKEGVSLLMLHPPFLPRKRSGTLAKQQALKDYYIDLSEQACIESSVKQFLEILSSIKNES